MLDALVTYITPALDETGDTQAVYALVEQLRARGTGSVHQRTVFAQHGTFEDVVLDAVERTRQNDRFRGFVVIVWRALIRR